MTRDEIQEEMIKVAEALENPKLNPDQLARGKARYEKLESDLMFAVQRERKEAEANKPKYTYPPQIQETINRTWDQLDPDGKYRRAKK